METSVPFSGFYETIDHDIVADRISYDLSGKPYDEVTDEELSKMMDYEWRKYEIEYCREWVDEVSKLLGIPLKFTQLDSPKYYNYSTDRIFAEINDEDVEKIKDMTDLGAMIELVRERFTSCDGFTSFYPNDYSKWVKKPFDHNQVGALIDCLLIQKHGYDWMDEVREKMRNN